MTDFYGLNLKNLLEKAHVGVVVHRWDTSIVYANPTALKLLGLSFEEISNKVTSDLTWDFVDYAGNKLLEENYPVNKVKLTQKSVTNEIMIFQILNSCIFSLILLKTHKILSSYAKRIIFSIQQALKLFT
jgi:PAS domain-containing protein